MNYFLSFLMVLFCAYSSAAQIYTEVAQNLNINHIYSYNNFGGGISFCDFDDDGWDDLTVATARGDMIHFYKNTGAGFQQIAAITTDTNEIKQLLWADIDNDGDMDLFTAVFDSTNYIYVNDGSFNFTAMPLPNPNNGAISQTFAADFGDYDIDGDLDLLITNRDFSGLLPNQLLQNDGNGNFTDVTANYFFDTISQPTFCVNFLDYNRDGLPDIYTAEDRVTYKNQLYKNLGAGQFEDRTDSCNAGVGIDGMGLAIGDYDHDHHLDIYVANGPLGNPLFHNNGDETFTDKAVTAGVTVNKVSWSSQFFDYDNDMDLDLHVCATVGMGSPSPDKNAFFENLGNGTFSDVINNIMAGDSSTSFSSAIGDINNDGYPDIAINNALPDSLTLWQSSGGTNNWIKIKLEGTISNRDGIGSWIDVYAGGKRRTHYTVCGSGYLGQSSHSKIIGLGTNSQADSIVVTWLSEEVSTLYNVAANQSLLIVEGQITASAELLAEDDFEIFPNPFAEYFTIKAHNLQQKTTSVRVLNSLGQLVYQRAWNTSDQLLIRTKDWASGVYFVQTKTGNDIQTKKLLKRH